MVKVFYCDISSLNLDISIDDFCVGRREYIDSIKDENRKKQSIYVWKLLLFALNSLGVSVSEGFNCNKGKWSLNNSNLHFSLSHSNNIVTVAISDFPVAVDVEMHSKKLENVVKKKFLSQINIPNGDVANSYAKIWTEFECKIKLHEKANAFSSNEVEDKLNNKYTIGLLANEEICLEKVVLDKIN